MVRHLWACAFGSQLWRAIRRSFLASTVRRYNRDHMIHVSHATGPSLLVSRIAVADRMLDGTFCTQEYGWVYSQEEAMRRGDFLVLKRRNKYEDGTLSCEYQDLTVCLCLHTGSIFYFNPALPHKWKDAVLGGTV